MPLLHILSRNLWMPHYIFVSSSAVTRVLHTNPITQLTGTQAFQRKTQLAVICCCNLIVLIFLKEKRRKVSKVAPLWNIYFEHKTMNSCTRSAL